MDVKSVVGNPETVVPVGPKGKLGMYIATEAPVNKKATEAPSLIEVLENLGDWEGERVLENEPLPEALRVSREGDEDTDGVA